MTSGASGLSTSPAGLARFLATAGILAAALTDAITGTILSTGRADILGDIHATPDEFAWLDIAYTAAKLVAFLATAWLMGRLSPRGLIIGAVLTMGAASGLMISTIRLDILVPLRALQGLSGGILLVAGQSLIFRSYARPDQPLAQAAFAVVAVVAPATMAPVLQGWLIDQHDWTWIVLGVVPGSLLAAGLLVAGDLPDSFETTARPFNEFGFVSLAMVAVCIVYVLSQGSRWDWFSEPHVTLLASMGVGAALLFAWRQVALGSAALLDMSVFRWPNFRFAFVVSFVAGAALFGSAYLIPSFSVALLALTPTDAGLLLLPSGFAFVASLGLAAVLFRTGRAPPIATVPFGIAMVMVAMWMLSGASAESGAESLGPAVLLRGFGLGFLFLSITLLAFGDLAPGQLGAGIGIFDTGRQIGGLAGVSFLQTVVDHQVAGNASVLGASLSVGSTVLSERLSGLTALLTTRGMDAAEAGRAAASLVARTLMREATVIAFDTAFLCVALLFVVAAPVLVAIKIIQVRLGRATTVSSIPDSARIS